MLSCKDVVKHSSEYVDGNLSFWGRASYKFHLFLCVNCRCYIRRLKLAIGVSRECAASPLTEEQAKAIAKKVCDQESH